MSINLDLKSSLYCLYFHSDVCKCGSKIDRNKSNNDRIVLECPTCKKSKEFIIGDSKYLFICNTFKDNQTLADFLYKLCIEYNHRNSTYETDKRSLTEWMADKIFENILGIKNNKKGLKEILGKHAENIKSYVNCIPKNTVGVIPPKGTKLYFSTCFPPVEVPPDAAWNDVRRMKRGVMITEYSMRLKFVAKALVDKLKEIENHPSYNSVFQIADIHGFKYNGPTYEKELKDLKDVLNENV